jgi:hypothetical protein
MGNGSGCCIKSALKTEGGIQHGIRPAGETRPLIDSSITSYLYCEVALINVVYCSSKG